MNKGQLIDAIVENTGESKARVTTVVTMVFSEIQGALAQGDPVAITGFGTFKVSQRAARTGVNPQNREQTINIPAAKVPNFKAGKTLKEAVNDGG